MGSVSLSGFAKITIPGLERVLKVQKTVAPKWKIELYSQEMPGFPRPAGTPGYPGPAWPEILKVTSSEVVNTSIGLEISIPEKFLNSLPKDFNVELFAEFTQHGANDESITTFEVLGTSYATHEKKAYATLPASAFAVANPGIISVSNPLVAWVMIGSRKKDRHRFVEGKDFKVQPEKQGGK